MDYDAIEDIENALPNVNDIYDPNTIIATINSITDANQFCNTYNHNNGYNGLKLGQRIKINNSTYYSDSSKDWYIAGFDLEHNQIAADGSTYDNGYGIFLIPRSHIINSANSTISFSWGNTTSDPITPIISSALHTSTIPTIASALQTVLGSCLVYRNVLLGSGIGSTYPAYTNSYDWTKTFLSVMSVQQILGIGYGADSIGNQYDTGEATYKLPLYNFRSPFAFSSITNYPRFTRATIRVTSYYDYEPIMYIAYSGLLNDTDYANMNFCNFITETSYSALLPLICINYDA